jgi:hypothetical protein
LGGAAGEHAGGVQPTLLQAGQIASPGAGLDLHRPSLRMDVSG